MLGRAVVSLTQTLHDPGKCCRPPRQEMPTAPAPVAALRNVVREAPCILTTTVAAKGLWTTPSLRF